MASDSLDSDGKRCKNVVFLFFFMSVKLYECIISFLRKIKRSEADKSYIKELLSFKGSVWVQWICLGFPRLAEVIKFTLVSRNFIDRIVPFCSVDNIFLFVSNRFNFLRAFSMSSVVNPALFFQSFQNLALFLTHHYYAFSKYVYTIALHLLWLACFKFFSKPSKS